MLPLLAWATTGAVFILQPGYDGAYEQIAVKTYSQDTHELQNMPVNKWQEVRLLKTILGLHLLERNNGVWKHLNGLDGQLWARPNKESLIRLLEDAITINPQRYGTSVSYQEEQGTQKGAFVSSTGVHLSVDWDTLSIRQIGQESQLINALYKIHYLQWTGNKTLDKFLAVTALLLLILLTVLGFKLFLRRA